MRASRARSARARLVHTLSVPIILFWVLLAGILSVVTPSLEAVGHAHSVTFALPDAPAYQAMLRVGKVFKEFDSDSTAVLVLEGQDKLGGSAHAFYNTIIAKLNGDHVHVEKVQDFWSDPLTAAGAQSVDGKAAYAQVFLHGSLGTSEGNDSVAAVRRIVTSVPGPAGVRADIAGNGVLTADTTSSADHAFAMMALVSGGVIVLMLLIIYRSIVTTLIVLLMVGVEVGAAQAVTATAGNLDLVGLTPYSVSMIPLLCLAASTDYVIFLLGRYHEARAVGQDREEAFRTAYQGVFHVILGSGLTIAGACLCLQMATLPYFQSWAWPCAIAVLVVMVAALTFAPAVLVVASRFGLLDSKRELSTRTWRKVGTAVVRWPVPFIFATAVIVIVGFLSLLTYTPVYNYAKLTPAEVPANVAQATAERHFSKARMNPDILMLEADHDLRNPADMLVVDRVAKAVFHLHGIERVQTITRPLGAPIEHSSIPFLISMQNANALQTVKMQNDNTAQMLQQADELSTTIATMERMYSILEEIVVSTHDINTQTHDIVADTNKLRDSIADFDDFFRPIRSYFYWEPNCFDIPACWSLRSVFDSIDSVDQLADKFQTLTGSFDHLDELMPQMLATLPPTIESLKTMRNFILSTHSTMAGIQARMSELAEGSTLMGQHFDEAKNDDSFYLPADVFNNPDFKRGLEMFVSPDGKAVRMIITHRGDPMSQEGIQHIAGIKETVDDAVKGTPLENAKVSLGGTASMYSDMRRGIAVDMLIVCVSATMLIFAIMLLITRSVVAALVIVGTVAASLGTACGLSVFVWQDIVGLGLGWGVLPVSVVILLAVGSDYNLLVVTRLREEIHAGLNTGLIRGMGATGRVVSAAGLVFALTMASMGVSDLRVIGQLGTTIGIGLLLDTLIVRSFMTPAIAAVLGRWFWWPLNTFTIIDRYQPAPESGSDTYPRTDSLLTAR